MDYDAYLEDMDQVVKKRIDRLKYFGGLGRK